MLRFYIESYITSRTKLIGILVTILSEVVVQFNRSHIVIHFSSLNHITYFT